MTPLAMRFCVGCGQVFDELQSSDSRPRWIAAEAYREKYGLSLNDLHLILTVSVSASYHRDRMLIFDEEALEAPLPQSADTMPIPN